MKRRNLILGSTAALTLAGCATKTKFKRYDGPEVTYVVVNKTSRKMALFHQQEVLRRYDIKLGFAPEGHKEVLGDGKTPEGVYRIDRRNPNSRYHLSIGISYPNREDVAAARAAGRDPGGDIFIHGQEFPFKADKGDWTWGCISVKNSEMEDIYAMVRDGTPIAINP